MPRYELVEGKSAKFWEIEVDGADVTTRWGRIGTNGQTKTKTFDDDDAAEAARDKQVASKVKKGYALVDDDDADDEKPAKKATPKKQATAKKKAAPEPPPGDGLQWVDTGAGYSLAIEDGKLVCRNAKGKRLASVPKKARDTEAAEQLKNLGAWLEVHERECAQTVDTWMLRALPVPRKALETVWQDPSWRGCLENAIVATDGGTGFFRGVEPKKGVGIVDLDGETTYLDPSLIRIPHPILLEDLDDWRELATELGLEQKITQLFRETWTRPKTLAKEATRVSEFANGKFEMLMHAVGRCRSQGYRVKGGYATCPVWEDGQMVEARYWIGAEYPDYETHTGELLWVDTKEKAIAIGDIGPTAYSEGMRMASAIFAGRVVDKEGEED